jgi:hypothetical protein
MIDSSTVVMLVAMYLNTYQPDHVTCSETGTYIADRIKTQREEIAEMNIFIPDLKDEGPISADSACLRDRQLPLRDAAALSCESSLHSAFDPENRLFEERTLTRRSGWGWGARRRG